MKTNNLLKHIIIVCLWIVSTDMMFGNPIDGNKAANVARNFMIKKFGGDFTIADIVPVNP